MAKNIRLGLACVCCLILVSCGGSSSPGSSPAQPPNAVAVADKSQGAAPLTVRLDASGSTDPQNAALSFIWSFSDGSPNVNGPVVSHMFNNHGSYTATVSVSDGTLSASKTIDIQVAPAPPTIQPMALSVNVIGVAPTNLQAQVSATDRENLSLTYTITSPPSIGSATINQNTGAITFTVPGNVSAGSTSFAIQVANLGASASANVNVTLNYDPLLANQWHIQNTGQDAFASTLPVAGNDADAAGAWTSGYTGKGIKVGVVDSGLEAAHEDLSANVDLSHSYNFITGANDPSPSGTGFDHGTAVAGIIGAVAFNGKGGRGIAYDATLRGYNLLAPGAFSYANMSKAMGGDPISTDNDIFNASFGAYSSGSSNALPSVDPSLQAITGNALTLRGGLGATFVIAAGNDFTDFEGVSGTDCATYAQVYGVSCGNPASDERRGGYYPIIVGAFNAAGVHSSYSNTGSSLWISAPGGEYGLNASYAGPGYTNYDPAIVTTSRDGCTNTEYSKAVNALDDMGANPLAPNCEYTATMNGTSAGTPITTATIALMLQANPQLSYRDIKYILAKTAKPIDTGFVGVSSSSIIPGSTVVLEQGWVKNAGGYTFSNRYGFGAIDAAAAVSMAKGYTSFLPALQTSTGNYSFVAAPPATITPMTTTGGYINYSVNESFQTVEFVVVFVNIDSTPGLQCNQIELTSPSGTKSILLHAANGFSNAQLVNTRFESNAFYGEPVNGTWALRFLDWCPPSGTATTLSTTQPQTLAIVGH